MSTHYLWEKLGPPIQAALQDPTIVEVILNPDHCLWVGDNLHGYRCVGSLAEHQALSFVYALAQQKDQCLNHITPYLDATLPFQGERIHITIPPVSESVAFNIRKMSPFIFSLEDYQEKGILSEEQLSVLVSCIQERKNILISGSPAAGKTTFANAVLEKIATESSAGERLLILEQVPELQCHLKNIKRLFTSHEVNMNTLLWMAMRHAPDRLVVGEVRDGAALDLLKAWNTGCRGGVATIHANNARMAVQRILDLACEAIVTPPYRLAAEALEIIVHIHRDGLHHAGRRVTEIIHVDDFNTKDQNFNFTTLA